MTDTFCSLYGAVPALLTRNPKGTNWGSFREDLRERLERPEMRMKNEAGLELPDRWIQQALIQAYEGNCPQRPVRNGKKSLKWTVELQRLRREVRWLFNKCRANNDTHSWEHYREGQRRYRKEVRKASKETWRAFCSSMRDLPRSVPWWLLPESIRNLKGKTWISCLPVTSLIQFG
jgi:hypothetical protein